jgi:DNA-binding NarL/FixJ family response regulator
MRILIVDDHPLVTAGLQSALQKQFAAAQVDVAETLASARAQIAALRYDLAIVDLNLPDGRGSALFSDAALAGSYPTHSLLLSGSQDRDDIAHALQMGATAYIAKTVAFDELLSAMKTLLTLSPENGPYWFDPAARNFVPAKDLFPRGSVLSAREHEIYELIRQGLTDKEIAYRLERSVHTVRVQIRSIRRKRGETRRASAAQAA